MQGTRVRSVFQFFSSLAVLEGEPRAQQGSSEGSPRAAPHDLLQLLLGLAPHILQSVLWRRHTTQTGERQPGEGLDNRQLGNGMVGEWGCAPVRSTMGPKGGRTHLERRHSLQGEGGRRGLSALNEVRDAVDAAAPHLRRRPNRHAAQEDE